MDEKRLDRFEQKLDNIDANIISIKINLAENNVILADHTRRSLANEKATEILKTELKPVLLHVAILNTLGKIALAVLCSDGIWELIKWLKS